MIGKGPAALFGVSRRQDLATQMNATLAEARTLRDLRDLPTTMRQRFDLRTDRTLTGTRVRAVVDGSVAPGFLFHPDGFVREAALDALEAPVNGVAVAWGVLLRLNDWVPEIRTAAWRALPRCRDGADPAPWVEALCAVFRVGRSWTRWGDGYDRIVAWTMADPGLSDGLVRRMAGGDASGQSRILRAIAPSPRIDPHLAHLAASARSARVRAMALDALIAGRIAWPLGTRRRVWTDKPMGRSVLKPVFEARDLTVTTDMANILRTALPDPAAPVRAVVLDALIRHRARPDMAPLIADARLSYRRDRRSSVRQRLDYLDRVMPPRDQALTQR